MFASSCGAVKFPRQLGGCYLVLDRRQVASRLSRCAPCPPASRARPAAPPPSAPLHEQLNWMAYLAQEPKHIDSTELLTHPPHTAPFVPPVPALQGRGWLAEGTPLKCSKLQADTDHACYSAPTNSRNASFDSSDDRRVLVFKGLHFPVGRCACRAQHVE
eukprot:1138976-Pelagomonas_calceolata.AAC.2